MSRSTPGNRLRTAIPVAMLLCSSASTATELDLTVAATESHSVFESNASDPIPVSFRKRPSGIDRYRMSKGLKVRGWQLGDGVYFGQAKVGKKWGVGVIVDRGQYVYGINNRGIQLLRRL
ncbi:MAG: hypothetical protein QGI68_00390 [Pseudomonadales bacterium]|nr:hypothetical protein [Pseudomonadales bacterium]MDP7358404.1 hypothetical protein [Pseudomonadales bacterium]MDP7594017.1 hypothetical protein [Pseudomonadales bacterium]HJN51636.1 hypothetical protein [Pseudomonadales bacterium]